MQANFATPVTRLTIVQAATVMESPAAAALCTAATAAPRSVVGPPWLVAGASPPGGGAWRGSALVNRHRAVLLGRVGRLAELSPRFGVEWRPRVTAHRGRRARREWSWPESRDPGPGSACPRTRCPGPGPLSW